MEAKDTVIGNEYIQDMKLPCETCLREPFWKTGLANRECMECMALKHREAQAEITWDIAKKAGVEQEHKVMIGVAVDEGKKAYEGGRQYEQDAYYGEILRIRDEEHKAGIKEVVDWFMENYPEVCDEHLTAQLEKWGID